MPKNFISRGEGSSRRRAPALTPEDREDQLVALAVDLAEKKLRDGTASNQVISYFLKQGSTREKLEKEKLIEENKLLKAKTEAFKMAATTEELYRKAIEAMTSYRYDPNEFDGDDNEH